MIVVAAFFVALAFVLWRRRRNLAKASTIGVGVSLGIANARQHFSPYRVPGRRGSKKITGGF